MKLSEVKAYLNKTVCFDTKQYDFTGTTIKEFILSGSIIRKDDKGRYYYQAELKESKKSRRVIIVELEKVMTEKK